MKNQLNEKGKKMGNQQSGTKVRYVSDYNGREFVDLLSYPLAHRITVLEKNVNFLVDFLEEMSLIIFNDKNKYTELNIQEFRSIILNKLQEKDINGESIDTNEPTPDKKI